MVVLNDGYEENEETARAIMEFSRGKIAGFKRPKTIDFVKDDEMPRTPTGKILHRILREKYGKWSDS